MNILAFYISWCRLERGHRRQGQMTDKIPELPTARHFLDLAERCLPLFRNAWLIVFYFRSVFNQYKHFDDMPDVTASYERLLIFLNFFLRIFKHNWRTFMSSPNYHRLCIWQMLTFRSVNMSDVTVGYGGYICFENFQKFVHVSNIISSDYGRLSDLNVFVWKFSYFIKLLQIVC